MGAEEVIIERMDQKGLKWFGNLVRMVEDVTYNWTPPRNQILQAMTGGGMELDVRHQQKGCLGTAMWRTAYS
jgi:hypothetical protein